METAHTDEKVIEKDIEQDSEKVTEKDTLYPELMDCSEALSSIVQDLRSVASIEEWLTSFVILKVSTIGELCSLPLKALRQLPIESPPHTTLRRVLASHATSKNSNPTPELDPVAAVPISKLTVQEESSPQLSSSLEICIESSVASEEEKSETNSSESITNGQIIRKSIVDNSFHYFFSILLRCIIYFVSTSSSLNA